MGRSIGSIATGGAANWTEHAGLHHYENDEGARRPHCVLRGVSLHTERDTHL
jgi:hypothetical protein